MQEKKMLGLKSLLACAPCLALVVSSFIFVPPASAQDATSLEALVLDWYEKLNNEDTSYLEYVIDEENVEFPRTGSLLEVYDGLDIEAEQALIDAGRDFDVQVRHLEARVYGATGVATYYTTGPTTYPDGSVLRGIFRASMIAAYTGNRWRVVHIHISPLQSTPED